MPFLALLGDRSSYSYFLNTRFENRAQVTYPVGLGKPIVPIVFFHMKRNDYPLNYIWRKTVISMEERIFT